MLKSPIPNANNASKKQSLLSQNNVQAEAVEDDSKTTKPFLKRKTKSIKPKRINWQTKSKIDCWNNQQAGQFQNNISQMKPSEMKQMN